MFNDSSQTVSMSSNDDIFSFFNLKEINSIRFKSDLNSFQLANVEIDIE